LNRTRQRKNDEPKLFTKKKGKLSDKFLRYGGRVKKFFKGCGKGQTRTRRQEPEEEDDFDDEIIFEELTAKIEQIKQAQVDHQINNPQARRAGKKIGKIKNYSGTQADLEYILSRILRGYRRLTVRNLKACNPKILTRLKSRIEVIGDITQKYLKKRNGFL